jgi:hypothetical protein
MLPGDNPSSVIPYATAQISPLAKLDPRCLQRIAWGLRLNLFAILLVAYRPFTGVLSFASYLLFRLFYPLQWAIPTIANRRVLLCMDWTSITATVVGAWLISAPADRGRTGEFLRISACLLPLNVIFRVAEARDWFHIPTRLDWTIFFGSYVLAKPAIYFLTFHFIQKRLAVGTGLKSIARQAAVLKWAMLAAAIWQYGIIFALAQMNPRAATHWIYISEVENALYVATLIWSCSVWFKLLRQIQIATNQVSPAN